MLNHLRALLVFIPINTLTLKNNTNVTPSDWAVTAEWQLRILYTVKITIFLVIIFSFETGIVTHCIMHCRKWHGKQKTTVTD